MIYWKLGSWQEAEKLQAEDMEISLRLFGSEHPDTLSTIANLASTYMKQEMWSAAEELPVQLSEARERVIGPNHPSTVLCMSNLALTYRNQGRRLDEDKLDIAGVIRCAEQGELHAEV